jgi:hypothetical protein
MHETILGRDTSTPPLQVVPPTFPSRATTRSKSKNALQSSLGLVAPFVANLRGQALPRQAKLFSNGRVPRTGPSISCTSLVVRSIGPSQSPIVFLRIDVGLQDLHLIRFGQFLQFFQRRQLFNFTLQLLNATAEALNLALQSLYHMLA